MRKHGIAAPKDKRLFSGFLKEEVPEFAALPAVRELREQFHSQKVEMKLRYPGRRKGSDPIEFVLAQYGEEISAGEFGPGRLMTIDGSLYTSLRGRLADSDPPQTMEEFFQSHRGEGKQMTRYQRKLTACRQLLDATDVEAAARFFGGLSADKVKKPEAAWGKRQ